MYQILVTTEELEYLNKLITVKLNTYSGTESVILESIKRKLDDPEVSDFYDAVDY